MNSPIKMTDAAEERIEEERSMRQELLGPPTNYSRAAKHMVHEDTRAEDLLEAGEAVIETDGNTRRDELLGKDIKIRSRRSFEAQAEAEGWTPEAQDALDAQRKRQEDLTDNILDMAKDLKERQKLIGNTLENDNNVLDSVGDHLDSNRNKLDGTNKTLKEEVDNYSRTSALMCFLLFAVCFMFIGMFVFMRLFPKRRPVDDTLEL